MTDETRERIRMLRALGANEQADIIERREWQKEVERMCETRWVRGSVEQS